MRRLLGVGVAWVPPLWQVPPLVFSYSDQRTVAWNHLCGHREKKGPLMELPPAGPLHLLVLHAALP
eukprot:4467741-Pyramimonas_sp.AAC.1